MPADVGDDDRRRPTSRRDVGRPRRPLARAATRRPLGVAAPGGHGRPVRGCSWRWRSWCWRPIGVHVHPGPVAAFELRPGRHAAAPGRTSTGRTAPGSPAAPFSVLGPHPVGRRAPSPGCSSRRPAAALRDLGAAAPRPAGARRRRRRNSGAVAAHRPACAGRSSSARAHGLLWAAGGRRGRRHAGCRALGPAGHAGRPSAAGRSAAWPWSPWRSWRSAREVWTDGWDRGDLGPAMYRSLVVTRAHHRAPRW